MNLALVWYVHASTTVLQVHCMSCTTVYGFFNESVAQPEQGPGYTVQVGYVKGARAPGVTTLIFDVQSNEGTASKLKHIVNFS